MSETHVLIPVPYETVESSSTTDPTVPMFTWGDNFVLKVDEPGKTVYVSNDPVDGLNMEITFLQKDVANVYQAAGQIRDDAKYPIITGKATRVEIRSFVVTTDETETTYGPVLAAMNYVIPDYLSGDGNLCASIVKTLFSAHLQLTSDIASPINVDTAFQDGLTTLLLGSLKR